MPILLTANPCISVCELDGDDRCAGCGRTKHEIKQWKRMGDEQRHDVNMRLLATQGKRVRKRLVKGLRKQIGAAGR